MSEPGFTILVVVGGQEVRIATSAETARRNVTGAMRNRHKSRLIGQDPSILTERKALHEAVMVLAADVLLRGDDNLREFQDADGRWWVFRGQLVSAIAVIDEAGTSDRTLGFDFRTDE
jgi:hypothetical protein